jgi:hypothetical protein
MTLQFHSCVTGGAPLSVHVKAHRTHHAMKTLIITLGCLVGFSAFAGLDKSLLREIGAWKSGQRPPARLLKFPDGKMDVIPMCGMGVWGDSVSHYFVGITNADLLAAVMFDNQTKDDSFHAAASRLTELKGVGCVSRLLADKRKAQPAAFRRSELAVLAQLLRSPYVAIQVARIAPEDMPPEKAEAVLRQMSLELAAGKAWAETYGKFSDLHPDMRDRAKDPKSVRTLICYLYDGTVSPSGFDILTYRTAENLPLEHLRELFRTQRGTYVFSAAGGVYLYHIRSYYDDAP